MAEWVDACGASNVDEEDVIRFDHLARTFIIVRDHEDNYYCTDGLCSHEDVHLVDGFVVEGTIECPKHSSIFDVSTGEVETPPACEDLATYPTKVEDGRVYVEV